MFSADSLELLKKSIAAAKPLAGPLDVQILPTPRCNAACVFCPLHAIPEPLMKFTPRFSTYTHDLPGGLLDRLADDLYHLGGLRRLTVTGGEPLLYSHLVPAVFQFLHSFPATEMTVVTNGIRLQTFAHFFVHAGLHRLSVSLNAGRPESYRAQNPAAPAATFDEIIAGVKAVTDERRRRQATRPHVTLSVVLTKASAGDVESLFELGRATGVDAVTYIPLMEILLEGQSINRRLQVEPGEFQRFLADTARFSERARAEGFFLGYAGAADDRGVIDNRSQFRDQPCYAGYAFAAVYPNGDVRPCCHCEPIMGNLQESSFVQIWRSEKYQRFRERMLKIAEGSAELAGCFCRECGYTHENREFAKKL